MKIGVIGAGAISGIYLENMVNKFENIEVAAIANRSMEKARKKRRNFASGRVPSGNCWKIRILRW